MKINFQRSELIGLLGVLTPNMAGSASLGIRTKDEMLEVFAYTDNGSAFARMTCKGVDDREWIYVDGPILQELVKLADEGLIEINFTETGLTLKFPCSMSELRSARIGVPLCVYNGEIDKIDPSIIASFLAESDGLSKKTTLNYHTGLSSLWNYLVENGYTEQNIVRVVKPPRPDEKQILPLTRQEIIALLEIVKDTQFPVRNRVVILLLLDCGLRASELCSLKVKDVDLINRRILIKGKGGKERKIPFCDTTQEALQAYFKTRKLSNIRDQYSVVFVSGYGNVISRRVLLLQLLVKIGIRAGVLNCHTHRFRHTFAIQFLRNEGNIYTLQVLLGHTQLDMVKRYLAIAQTDLDRDHEKASPVKGWGL